MKKVFFFLAAFAILALNNCAVGGNDLDDDNANGQWSEYCSDLEGGELTASIDGQNWSTNCIQAVYSKSETPSYEQTILYIFAYNFDGTYFNTSEIEMLYLFYIETTANGQTEVLKSAAFYDGFFDYINAVNNPNYEIEDLNIYVADEDDENNVFDISQISSEAVSGNVSFTLTEEETGNETISLSGNFTANIVQ